MMNISKPLSKPGNRAEGDAVQPLNYAVGADVAVGVQPGVMQGAIVLFHAWSMQGRLIPFNGTGVLIFGPCHLRDWLIRFESCVMRLTISPRLKKSSGSNLSNGHGNRKSGEKHRGGTRSCAAFF